MPVSYFEDKMIVPQEVDLKIALGSVYPFFQKIYSYMDENHTDFRPEWKHYGKKMGWQLKLLKGKRNIMFIVPFDKNFIVAFVFGDKAVQQVMDSDLPEEIKTELQNAKKYMEGRVINFSITEDSGCVADIIKLIEIKLNN